MPQGPLPYQELLEDWLIAFAMAWTAVSALVVLFVALFFGGSALIDHRDPDRVQDYTSPDGKYVATLRTESGRLSSLCITPIFLSLPRPSQPRKRSIGANLTWFCGVIPMRASAGNHLKCSRSRFCGIRVTAEPTKSLRWINHNRF